MIPDLTHVFTSLGVADFPRESTPGIDALMASAAIIALGEPTHGQTEMQQFRAWLTIYAVDYLDADCVVFEAPSEGWRRINDTLHSSPTKDFDLNDAGYWMYKVSPVRAMLETLRTRNVRVAGIDVADPTAITWAERDESMADNVMDLVRHGRKVVLWAHNGHITRDAGWLFDPSVTTMGMHLSETLGTRYRALGGAFGTGDFTAYVTQGDQIKPRVSLPMGDPAHDSLDGILLAASSAERGIFDFELLTAAARIALDQPLASRTAGASVEVGEDATALVNAIRCYDGMLFVPRTTGLNVIEP